MPASIIESKSLRAHMNLELASSLCWLDRNPILNRKAPDNWLIADYFPVPVAYFCDLHKIDLWIYSQKFGGKYHHLGPRVFGTRFFNQNGRGAFEDLYPCGQDIEEEPDSIMVDDSMTSDEQDEIELEQQRRQQTRALLKSLKIAKDTSPTRPAPELAPAAGIGLDTNIQDLATLPALTQAMIIDFIKANRYILAFPSMHFPMAGHVLYAHLIRAGLVVTYEQFRLFLLAMRKEKGLFL